MVTLSPDMEMTGAKREFYPQQSSSQGDVDRGVAGAMVSDPRVD
jgi:hypothetical protein